MADIDLASIADPISDEQPCGPDLDMEFDADFMNFEANVGMAWPERYFSWDPASLKDHTYYDQIAELLERSRDLRLLVPLAKLRILEGDILAFAETLEAIEKLLKAYWSDVHPQPADFLELSMGQLATLDDNPSCVLPFQHARIVGSRRSGPITYRKWLVGTGEVNPREEEDRVDAGTLSAAIAEADSTELERVLGALQLARDSLAGIRLVCIEEAGYENAPALENLPKVVDGAIAMVESATGGLGKEITSDAAHDEGSSAALTGGVSAVVQLPVGAVDNREAAIEAMHAAAKYFALFEPSSPAPMLLREAQNAASKSFYELVNDLVPDTAASAFVTLGREPWFEVSLAMLEQRNPSPDYVNDHEESVEENSWETIGLEGESLEGEEPTGNDDVSASTEEDRQDSLDESANVGEASEPSDSWTDFDLNAGNSSDEDSVVEQTDAAEGDTASENDESSSSQTDPAFVANSRPEAIDLMNKVLSYYRVAEPSSPVSLIIERALELSSKNFIELLGNVLPEGSLKVTPTEDSSSSGW